VSAKPTNTAGLEAAAKLADHLRPFEHHAVGSLRIDMNEVRNVIAACDFAASAQARIAALEARVAELEATKWEAQHADTMNDLVAMGLARDAAEARADRLATLSKRLSARLCDVLERAYVTDAEWVKTEYPNGVSEKLVIDSAIQDQPK
jgi:hypothetical protein